MHINQQKGAESPEISISIYGQLIPDKVGGELGERGQKGTDGTDFHL